MSSGLSTRTGAGIALGAIVCVLGFGALIVFMIRMRTRKKRAPRNNHYIGMPPAQYPGFQYQRGYTRGVGYSPSTTKSHVPKTQAKTPRTPMPPQELPAEPAAVELPAHLHRGR
ncbi:hypothetical protein F4677DRAFT_227229 [Hypoxylon crocopeplum]|nr:hypothetical protein F4677DRAFT_227229 [Hypoxylon crocopeplum]